MVSSFVWILRPATSTFEPRLPEGGGWDDAVANDEALYLMSSEGNVTRISAPD